MGNDMIDDREEILEELSELEGQLAEQEDVLEEEPVEEEELLEEPEQDDEVVTQAKKYGHISKEDWIAQGRDPNQWKSPEKFNETGKILQQIFDLRDRLDKKDKVIAAMVDYQQRTAQREYERAKLELQQKLQASRDDMNVEDVEYYSKELTQLQIQEQQQQEQYYQQQRQEVLNSFQERNAHWFNDQNPELKKRATEMDLEFNQWYPQDTYEQRAQRIEARIQAEYPDKVSNTPVNKPRPTITRSPVNKAALSKPSKSFSQLPQDLKMIYEVEKKILESIPGAKEYTQADFIAKLKKDGEI